MIHLWQNRWTSREVAPYGPSFKRSLKGVLSCALLLTITSWIALGATRIHVDFGGSHTQMRVFIGSSSYGEMQEFEVSSRPSWIDIEPWRGLLGSEGTSLLLKLDRSKLQRGPFRGQVIVALSGQRQPIVIDVEGISFSFGDNVGAVLIGLAALLLLGLLGIFSS